MQFFAFKHLRGRSFENRAESETSDKLRPSLAAALILLQLRELSRRIDRAEDRAENRASEDRVANKADHARQFNAVSDL